MNFPLRLLLCSSAFWLPATLLLSAEPTPLAQLLSPEEFQQAGLKKLSAAEITALEAALARHNQIPAIVAQPGPVVAANTPPAVNPTGEKIATKAEGENFGAEQVDQAKPLVTEKELHTQIEGTIESLTGRSVFVLQNGQIWQQRIPDVVVFSPPLKNPAVVITRGLIGYKMVLTDANRVIYVKRIK